MNRKEACKAISFILIFVLLLTGVSYIVRTNGHVKDRFAGFYAEEKNSIDVLMFGSSTVATSFSSGYMWGKYGFTSYPLSSNTQRPKAIKYLLEEAYNYQSPEVIVVELRMFTYEDSSLKEDEAHIREVTDNMRYSFQRLKTVHNLTDSVKTFEDRLSFYFDIVKYHSNWTMFFLPEELQKIMYKKSEPNKGFEMHKDIINLVKEQVEYFPTKEKISISQEQEKILVDLLNYLNEKEQEAIFVVTPCTHEAEYFAKMNYIKDIVEQKGFIFINMLDNVKYDCTTDYYDGSHSNILGAKKCSDLLGQIISDNYDIADKRGQKGYESWDESYKAFMDIYNEVNNNKEEYIVQE